MIKRNIGEKILTVGCKFNPPKGGVAQVLYSYSQEVYSFFRFIENSGNEGYAQNVFLAVFGIVKLLLLLIWDKRIRIVHIHTASYNSFLRSSWFLRIAKLMGKKVVLHIHGGDFKNYYQTNSNWILKMLSKADCILALTDSWNQFYSEELHLPNVVTVPNIIPEPILRQVCKNSNGIHLLFLGAINEQKGIFDLLSVINLYKKDWCGKMTLHIGGNQEVERLLEYIKMHKLEGLVHYEGWVEGDNKIELLNQMDAFILPSYVEGLPISILESLSYGKPVITTYVGGIPEVVSEKNGFLFEPGDKETLSEIINTIIKDPTILNEKGEFARESVSSNCPDSIVEVLNKTYKNLIGESI